MDERMEELYRKLMEMRISREEPTEEEWFEVFQLVGSIRENINQVKMFFKNPPRTNKWDL